MQFSGRAARTWGGPLRVSGKLTLRQHRIEFAPQGRMFADRGFTVALEDLDSIGWRSLRARLALVTREETYTLHGPLILRLAVALQAMGVPMEGAPTQSGPEKGLGALVHTEKCSQVSGPIHYPGWLALGRRNVVFNASGLMEQLVGVDDLLMPLDRLASAQAQGTELTITGAGRTLVVHVENAASWVGRLAAHGAQTPLAWDVDLEPPERGANDEPLFTFDAVWQEPAAGTLRRGRATLLKLAGVAFRGLDGTQHTLSKGDVQRSVFGQLSDDEDHALRIPVEDGTTVVLRPRGGSEDVAMLRDFVLSLPMVDAVDLGELGRLRKVEGEVTFARITSNHRDAISFRSGWIVQAPDSIGLVIKDHLDWDVPRGTRVKLTVGIDRGVYEINGRLIRREEVPANQLAAGDGRPFNKDNPDDETPQRVLFVAIPHVDKVSFTKSRRKDYRVPATEPMSAREMRWSPGKGRTPWGKSFDGRLIDLSAGGCGVLLGRELTVGRFLEVRITIAGRARPLVAEVVHVARLFEDDLEWWRHGLRFEGLDEGDHTWLAREVHRREMRAVRQGDEPEEDDEP